MDDKLKDEILRSIQLQGGVTEESSELNVIIASRPHLASILDFASGLPKVRASFIKKFNLILSQPEALSALSPLSIRCCLCGKIISYPAWYLVSRFAINHFHYFICFNNSGNKPSTKCYRRVS